MQEPYKGYMIVNFTREDGQEWTSVRHYEGTQSLMRWRGCQIRFAKQWIDARVDPQPRNKHGRTEKEQKLYDEWVRRSGFNLKGKRSAPPHIFTAAGVLHLDTLPETQETVDTSYRKLAMIHHPDHGGTEDGMKRLNEARLVLSKFVQSL